MAESGGGVWGWGGRGSSSGGSWAGRPRRASEERWRGERAATRRRELCSGGSVLSGSSGQGSRELEVAKSSTRAARPPSSASGSLAPAARRRAAPAPARAPARKAGGKARGRQQTAAQGRAQGRRPRPAAANGGAEGLDFSGKNVAELRDAAHPRLIRPLNLIMLTRDRIEEVARTRPSSAVALPPRTPRTSCRASVERGREQTDDVLERPRGAAQPRRRAEATSPASAERRPSVARASRSRRGTRGRATSAPARRPSR